MPMENTNINSTTLSKDVDLEKEIRFVPEGDTEGYEMDETSNQSGQDCHQENIEKHSRVANEATKIAKPEIRSPGMMKPISRSLFTKYRWIKLLQLLGGGYILVVTFTQLGTFGTWGGFVDPVTGYIIDVNSQENTENGVINVRGFYRAIVARNNFQMVALAISRFSAYTMYPALILVFLTKFRATANFFSNTYIGYLLQHRDLHDLHAYCGYYILIDSIIHTTFHVSRYANQGNIRRLIDHPSGLSGLVIIFSTFLICLPMIFGKERIRFEVRKYAHYFFLVFMIALCFHSPRYGTFAPYVFGALTVWWALDSLYVQFFMTERIASSRFYVLPTGVQLTMAVSERFNKWGTGGYAYVCLPWVDPHQWHAFSLFENPAKPEERQVFMQVTGDWTRQVHHAVERDTSRPVWIQGPFASPFAEAIEYDNQIMVAGGIGITPALSAISELKTTRRCNLIWATRDRHMLEFFLKHADLSDRGWNLVFYTGKEPLLGIEDVVVTANGAVVYIIRERPNLQVILPNIIHGIESGCCRPEMLKPPEKAVAMELLQEKLLELEDYEPPLDTHETLSELEAYCDELGYFLSDLVSQLPGSEALMHKSRGDGWDDVQDHRALLDAILEYEGDMVGNIEYSQAMNVSPGSDAIRADSLSKSLRASVRMTLTKSPPRRKSMRYSKNLSKQASVRRSMIQIASKRDLMSSDIQGKRKMNGIEEIPDSDVEAALPLIPSPRLYKPWIVNGSAQEYVNKLDEEVLSTWGVLYCGGKTPLEKALKDAAWTNGIEMHTESFAW